MDIFKTKKMAELEFDKAIPYRELVKINSLDRFLERIVDIEVSTIEFNYYSSSKKSIQQLNKMNYIFNEWVTFVIKNQFEKQLLGWDAESLYLIIEDILEENISLQEKIELITKRLG